jgi:hypothetical protein
MEHEKVIHVSSISCDWKKLKHAGRRWIAEIVFSSIKRELGEDLLSKKFSTQKVEAGLKVMLYNRFISL